MATNFNEQAPEYHQSASIQRDLASWTAEWLEPSTHELDGVEFGAGTGYFTGFAVKAGIRLRSIDLSPRMIEIGSTNEPQAHWERGNAWEPQEKLRTDRIFSCGLLQWCSHPDRVLSRWRNCLRENGRLLSGLFVCDTLPELSHALPGVEPFAWRNEEEWIHFFEKAGFKVVRSEVSQRQYRFENAIAVLRYLHKIGSVEPKRFSAGVLRTALQNYDAAFPDSGSVPSTWTFLRIECRCRKTD